MAKNDVRIVDHGGHDVVPVFTFRTEAAATQLLAGEPAKRGGTGNNYAVPLATGDPEIGTDLMLGIVAKDSTETASADGTVDIYMPLPGVVYECDATTAANVDTDAELLLLLLDRVTFDLTGSTYTVDEDEGDDADHGLVIVDGDVTNSTIKFQIRNSCTLFSNNDV